MYSQVPVCKRCCFCLPLRYGLLVWSYLLLIPLSYILFCNIEMMVYIIKEGIHSWIIQGAQITSFLLLFITYGLTFLLIVAAHKKSGKLMKIYLIWAFRTTVVHFFVTMFEIYYDVIMYWQHLPWRHIVVVPLLFFIYFGIQLYVLLLVRSETIKLESNHSFEFFNIAAEAEREYYEPGTKDIPDTVTLKIDDNDEVIEINKPAKDANEQKL